MPKVDLSNEERLCDEYSNRIRRPDRCRQLWRRFRQYTSRCPWHNRFESHRRTRGYRPLRGQRNHPRPSPHSRTRPNPARQAHINAGLPIESAAWSINQVCGSGLRAVALAAQHIQLGDADIVAAGGQENMTLSPMLRICAAAPKWVTSNISTA